LGLTQPAVYKHFRNKEDIWRSIAEGLGNQVEENIAFALAADKAPLDRLRLLFTGHLKLIQNTPALPEIMVARDPKGDQNVVRSQMQSSMTDFQKTITSAVAQGRQDGDLRKDVSDADMTTLLFGIIQGLALRLLMTRNPAVLVEDGERLLELLLSAFTENEEIA
ncbi:MAG: hypothetical protein COA52_17500, partial [Hyphomicrobiales bacterium]